MSRFHYRRRQGVHSPALPRNTVLHGDCIEVLATLPAESVDLVLTDPPYLCNYRDRSGRRVANDNNSAWVSPAFEAIARVMKPGSFCVSFYGWQHAEVFLNAWRTAGFTPVGHLVFPKPYVSSTRLIASSHEQAYVLAKGRWQMHGPALRDVLPWAYTGNLLHPTQKPLKALTPIIDALSRPGQLVLDPFAGSGSTLVAARDAGRDYLGIELDAGHAETVRERVMRSSA